MSGNDLLPCLPVPPNLYSRPLRERNAPLEKKEYSSYQSNDDCFIATAAYGTPIAPEINLLRWWRDKHLANKKYGQFLISKYYKHSPPIANSIRNYSLMRFIIRQFIKIILFGIRKKFQFEKQIKKFNEVMK